MQNSVITKFYPSNLGIFDPSIQEMLQFLSEEEDTENVLSSSQFPLCVVSGGMGSISASLIALIVRISLRAACSVAVKPDSL